MMMVVLAAFIISSDKDYQTDDTHQFIVQKSNSEDNSILDNPYEFIFISDVIEQIKQSSADYNQMNEYKSGLDISNFTIEPNFKYVKFTPESWEQHGLLRSDSTLILLDYPLSYQSADHYYIDNPQFIPDDEMIPAYYTSVPFARALPQVPYEVLQDMYVPDEDSYFQVLGVIEHTTIENRITDRLDLINHIYTMSHELSNNRNFLPPDVIQLDPTSGVQAMFFGISFRSLWRPKGNIKIWDENVGTTTTSSQIIVGYENVPCNTTGMNDSINYLSDSNGAPATGGSSTLSGIDFEIIDQQTSCRKPIYETISSSENGSFVGLAGAQVLIRNTFTLGQGITDINGNFQTRRVRPGVRYVIQWERYHYSIRDNWWQAELKGPKMRDKNWNKKIRGGEDAYHTNIHRGSYMYYYANLPGLLRPPTNGDLHRQMKIAAVENNGASNHVPFRRFLFGASDIRIKEFRTETSNVVGTTIHELAHAMHWRLDKQSYNNLVYNGYIDPTLSGGMGPTANSARRTMETWATYIEALYTQEFYERLGAPADYKYRSLFKKRLIVGYMNNESNAYNTACFYDLIDDFNQRIEESDNGLPNDPAEGYTPIQLQNALDGVRSWNGYRDNIKSLNVDFDNDIDVLFRNW